MAAYGQIYTAPPVHHVTDRAGGHYAPADGRDRLEIYGGATTFVLRLQDDEDTGASFLQQGTAAGVRVWLSSRFALGVEGQYLPHVNADIAFLKFIRQRAAYITARWDVTPDTYPLLYVSAGAGGTQTRLRFELSDGREPRLRSAVFFAGAGMRLALGGGWNIDLSLRATYMRRSDFGFLLRYASRWSAQGAVFAVWRF